LHIKTIKEIPVDDRPREKMANKGATALTDAELVAILLRTGTAEKSALDIASELTADGGLYKRLASITRLNELMNIKGLGQAKAATVLAALEIGRRIASAKPVEKIHLSCPQDVADFLMPRLRYAAKEQFVVILLNNKNKVIGTEVVSEGSLSSSIVHPREVYAPAILHHAAAIMVAHNHPSGDPKPSIEDEEVTRQLLCSGKVLGIPMIDHVIIGDGNYYSFLENEAF
jgi:DNA repair protein RadC